jgi:transmembrane sensor
MMTDYIILYQKFLDQTCSPQEAEMLLNYFRTEEGDGEMVKLIKTTFERPTAPFTSAQDEQSIRNNELRIMKAIRSKNRILSLRQWYSAAAVLSLIGMGIWFYRPAVILNIFQDSNAIAMRNQITPGKNTAMLTLADGETITLSDAKKGIVIGRDLRYNDNTIVNPNKKVDHTIQTLIASTPRGGTYQISLPDGSKVWLNAASKLTFPSSFSTLVNDRIVELDGEAYFEIAKNKARPFMVKSHGQQVKVLGTHFNISAYKDESIRTTLLEGSVSVRHTDPRQDEVKENNELILKPNQQSLITESGAIALNNVDATQSVAWKNGYFRFDHEDIQSVMKKIARWYNVEVAYEGNPTKEGFTGKVSRNRNIGDVLMILEKTKGVKFKIEGRRITVIN